MKLWGSTIANYFLTTAGILMASVVVVYFIRQGVITGQRKIVFQREIILHLEDFVSTLKDAETGQRGYLLTGDEKYLEPYNGALTRVRAQQADLGALASTGVLPAQRVGTAIRLSEDKLAELEQTIRIRRQSGLEPALTIVRAGLGKESMDKIREVVAELVAPEELDIQRLQQQARTAEVESAVAFLLTISFNLFFLTWAYGRMAREIRNREAAEAERNRQMQLLAQEKELITTTLASIGDGVIVTDVEGRITFLNQEGERLTGWKAAEAAGQRLPAVFRIINEETRQTVENPVDRVLRLGTATGLANHTLLIAKDGRETSIDDSAAPIRLGGQPLFGVVLVFRDFTEQRNAQLVLSRSKKELENLVSEQTQQLRAEVIERKRLEAEVASAAEAEQERLGQELHDGLGQELTGMAMMLDALTMKLTEAAPQQAADAQRLGAMLRASAEKSRHLAKGLYPVEIEKYGLLVALQELARRNQEKFGVSCKVEAGQNVPGHLQDERAIQLYRIAQEALHNATKHAKAKHILLRLTTQDGVWILTVKDYGVGLPADAQATNGMGLRIMRYRAHMIGGMLSVRNDDGGGVIVTCSVPAVQTD